MSAVAPQIAHLWPRCLRSRRLRGKAGGSLLRLVPRVDVRSRARTAGLSPGVAAHAPQRAPSE
eukprot:7479420-Alexandrium_andersonii.AAC.1